MSRKGNNPGVISQQTVSKPWQSNTWLVDNGNEGPTRFYYFDLPAELFLLRNEIIVAIRKKICTSPSSMVAPQSPRGFEKSDRPTPIQTSYFIGPYNLRCLLFSGIGALLCHHPYCFPSQSQTLFGIGAGRPPITAVAR